MTTEGMQKSSTTDLGHEFSHVYDNVKKIKGLKDSRGSDNYVLTEQDLKNIIHENDLDGESAEVIELR